MKGALKDAFRFAQQDITVTAILERWDIQTSGSAVVGVVWKDDIVWTANTGDCRAAIGVELHGQLLHETIDHKPTDAREVERIEFEGGEVRSKTYMDGWTSHRVFLKGKQYPGLSMTRSLGDDAMKLHGVIAEPDIEQITVNLDDKPFIILASDGVWEFLGSEFVVKAVGKRLSSDGPEMTLQKLNREARKRWKTQEGSYCDDITAVLVQMG